MWKLKISDLKSPDLKNSKMISTKCLSFGLKIRAVEFLIPDFLFWILHISLSGPDFSTPNFLDLDFSISDFSNLELSFPDFSNPDFSTPDFFVLYFSTPNQKIDIKVGASAKFPTSVFNFGPQGQLRAVRDFFQWLIITHPCFHGQTFLILKKNNLI